MPEEYKKLMKGFNNEDEFVRDALGLSKKAMQHYSKQSRKNGAMSE